MLVAEGPAKYCPDCGFKRPRHEFYASTTKGRVYAHTYCKTHEKARTMAWQRRNREKANAISSRAYYNRKQDPERFATFQEQRRQYMRRRRGITPDRYRVGVVPSASTISLTGGPFVEFFESVMARDEISLTQLAARWGMSDKTLREIRKGRRDPSIETVERALIADGTASLDDLYPRLFAEAA